MATTEEILAEIDGLLGKSSMPSAMVSTAPQVSTIEEPASILGTALTPSSEAAGANLSGLWDIAKRGATTARYGLSYLSPFESAGSGYRAYVDAQIEKAKKDAQKADEDRRVSLNLTPEQYVELKKTEANSAYRHLGGQVIGGITGAEFGGAAGAATFGGLNTAAALAFPPLAAAIPYTTAAGTTLGTLIGGYLGAGTGETGVQKAEEGLGWTKETSDLEKAKKFSEAGTGQLIADLLPGAIKTGTKGTVKAVQAGREYLGPKTLNEALASVQPKMEAAMPAGKVRTQYAKQVGREHTAGMKTTGELLNTPEALNVEQAVGLTPLNQETYNTRLIENIDKGQEFITEKVLKEGLQKESKAAKSNPIIDVNGKVIEETAPEHLKAGEVSRSTIGKEMGDAFDNAAAQSQEDLKPLYQSIEHVDTNFRDIKVPINKALEAHYPTVTGKRLPSGNYTTEFSGIPDRLKTIVKHIVETTSASTHKLNLWQSQLRSMGKAFARQGDEVAAKAAGDVRTQLINKIESTTAGEKWTGARGAAKERADIINNHELGKAISKEDLNGETIFNKVTASESNAKNFVAAVGENHPVVRSTKAYAIKTLESMESASAKANWINKNSHWLKQFFNKSEFESLQEVADIGSRTAAKGRKLNALGGSPTARREAVRQTGLGRIVGRGEETTVPGSKVGKYNNLIRNAVVFGGGYAAADQLGFDKAGIAASILAAALGGKALAKRRDIGTKLMTQAAYDISMNPKVAGWTAPQLAKAFAAKKAGQLETAGLVGEVTGRLAQAGVYGGRLSPQKVEAIKQIKAATATPVHVSAAQAADEIRQLLGKPTTGATETAPIAAKPATPKILSVKPISTSTADADAHIATKPAIIQAMAMAESGSKKDAAVSPKGARGRMQLMPATAKEMGADINDPISNIDAGEAYFNKWKKKYGDERIALIAYNWGPGRVENIKKRFDKRGIDLTWSNIEKYASLPTETENYITRVLKNKQKLMRA